MTQLCNIDAFNLPMSHKYKVYSNSCTDNMQTKNTKQHPFILMHILPMLLDQVSTRFFTCYFLNSSPPRPETNLEMLLNIFQYIFITPFNTFSVSELWYTIKIILFWSSLPLIIFCEHRRNYVHHWTLAYCSKVGIH